MSQPIRACAAAKVIGVSVLLMAFGGCSGDDIQLNGKVFDAVGIGSGNKRTGEPQIASRSPLVMPPNVERLPQPGKQEGGESADVAAINDPDKKVDVSQAELQKQQAEYCKVNYEQAKQRGDEAADLATGPLGSCRGSVLSLVGLGFGQGEEK